MLKKRITLLELGGTIAMAPNAVGALAPGNSLEEIVASQTSLTKVANITFEQIQNNDSNNIHPEDWTKLSRRIFQLAGATDAIIITHGTDTMPYTAGAVSLALGKGLKIPVIFTGSQRSMLEHGSDARINLEHSIETAIKASEMDIAEVMIVFDYRILRASRSVKITEVGFIAFDSPAYPDLASVTANGIWFSPNAKRADHSVKFELSPHFNSKILAVDVVPGLDPTLLSSLLSSGKCNGLILRGHGPGNIPCEGEYSLLPLIKEATQNLNIPILITTKIFAGRTHLDRYEPGYLAQAAGAIPTSDLTSTMVQVKLMWVLAQGFGSLAELSQIINTNTVGELSPEVTMKPRAINN